MRAFFARCGLMAPVFGLAALLTRPAAAELPPQYTVWQDFAAITATSEIPAQLGVVDRIERINPGYRVFSGNCWVDVTISRKGPSGSDGRPMVGPSRIVSVKLGAKTCN